MAAPRPRSGPRRWSRRLLRVVAAMVCALGLLVLAIVAGALLPGPVRAHAGGGEVAVGLVQGPIHTDLVLPVTDELRAALPFLDLGAGTQSVAVGWGARGIYTVLGDWGDVSAAAILRAGLGDAAVIRFQPIDVEWQAPMQVTLTTAGYSALIASIAAETRADAPAGHDLFAPGDRFFAADGRFSALSPCNQWAGRRLREAGHPFGAWTPTTWAFRLSLRRFAGAR